VRWLFGLGLDRSMPQFRQPGVAPRVQRFFAAHGLRYDVRPYWASLGLVLLNLRDVGNSAGAGPVESEQKHS